MRTLITGAGLVGCHTTAFRLAQGDTVVLLDACPQVQAISALLPLSEITLECADIRDRSAMQSLLVRHRIDTVVHTAAALSSAIRQTPALAADVNLGGTVNLLEAACRTGVRRFVLASSTTVAYPIFGRPLSSPVPEDFAFHAVSERPASLYAASKLAAEFFAQEYARQFDLSLAVLRYSAVLGLWAGPNNSVPGRLMATLLGQGARDGRVRIEDPLLLWSGGDDFIDVRDVARANSAAMEAPSSVSGVYTIGSGRLDTFGDFVNAARGVRSDLQFDDPRLPATGFAGFPHPRAQPFDVRRARDELGFEATHDLAASLRAGLPFV